EHVGDVAVREEAGPVAAASAGVVVERLAVLVVEQYVDRRAAEVLEQAPARWVPARIALPVVGRIRESGCAGDEVVQRLRVGRLELTALVRAEWRAASAGRLQRHARQR